MQGLKRSILLNLKNIPGWRTRRKIVVFSVDDYGNIRIASEAAREAMRDAGLNINANRFDQYDALETANDLKGLYDTLTSVTDANGEHAKFTAFALPANIDFNAIADSGYNRYHYELLPDTFSRLPGYEGTWDLWQEGIAKKLLNPEFHGREHLSIKVLMHLLRERNPEVMACFANASYGALSAVPFKTISYTAAFEFDHFEENNSLNEVIKDGLNVFEKVFGFRASHFNAPGAREHHCLDEALSAGGIKFIDTDTVKREHQGQGRYKKHFHYLGQKNRFNQVYLIRNCVFEPLLKTSFDWVASCLAQMEIAFRWGKPANISSHRVNFCGHIDHRVRENGLLALRKLLHEIVKRWPDVEFMTSKELGTLIVEDKNIQ